MTTYHDNEGPVQIMDKPMKYMINFSHEGYDHPSFDAVMGHHPAIYTSRKLAQRAILELRDEWRNMQVLEGWRTVPKFWIEKVDL